MMTSVDLSMFEPEKLRRVRREEQATHIRNTYELRRRQISALPDNEEKRGLLERHAALAPSIREVETRVMFADVHSPGKHRRRS